MLEDSEEGNGAGDGTAKRHKNMLVFDFGGGTLDVTIMQIDGDAFKVRSAHPSQKYRHGYLFRVWVNIGIYCLR